MLAGDVRLEPARRGLVVLALAALCVLAYGLLAMGSPALIVEGSGWETRRVSEIREFNGLFRAASFIWALVVALALSIAVLVAKKRLPVLRACGSFFLVCVSLMALVQLL